VAWRIAGPEAGDSAGKESGYGTAKAQAARQTHRIGTEGTRFASLAFMVALLAPGRATAARAPSAEFTVSASNGETRVVHLSHKGKTSGCVFPRRIVRRLGTFTGQSGYTVSRAAEVHAAGGVGPRPRKARGDISPARALLRRGDLPPRRRPFLERLACRRFPRGERASDRTVFQSVDEAVRMSPRLLAQVRRLALAGLLALTLGCVSAAPSNAAAWTDRQLPAMGQAPLFGISCPSVSLCVAVGSSNTIASSADPSAGAAAWSATSLGGVGYPNQNEIKGISCPYSQLCVAVSFEGLIFTSTDPTGGAAAWSIADLNPSGPRTHLYGISCPSPSFCAASAGGARILTSTNPTGGAGAWTMTQLASPLQLRGISCASPSFCVAVGDDGDKIAPASTDVGEILSSADPLGGVWQQVEVPGQPGNLFGVSCPSPVLCVTGNALGNLLVSTGPASAWSVIDGGGSVQLTAAECPSATRCLAVDNNADVLTSTDPTGGPGAWTFTNLIPYTDIEGTFASNAMWGASCPSVSFCAIAAGDGQVFTSEDPFAEPPPPAKKKGKRRRSHGPKRPRAKIGPHPESGIEFSGRKLTVRFGFYEMHRAPVRGFVCRLDRRPLRRCSSPKSYRVSFGRHVFRVRAIGSTGLRGPAAKAFFRVCHPTPYPQCIRHLPPPSPPSGRVTPTGHSRRATG
jgi:hypothetical protein